MSAPCGQDVSETTELPVSFTGVPSVNPDEQKDGQRSDPEKAATHGAEEAENKRGRPCDDSRSAVGERCRADDEKSPPGGASSSTFTPKKSSASTRRALFARRRFDASASASSGGSQSSSSQSMNPQREPSPPQSPRSRSCQSPRPSQRDASPDQSQQPDPPADVSSPCPACPHPQDQPSPAALVRLSTDASWRRTRSYYQRK